MATELAQRKRFNDAKNDSMTQEKEEKKKIVRKLAL